VNKRVPLIILAFNKHGENLQPRLNIN